MRLSTVARRSLLRRKGRYALTGLGIALGVAIAFAVLAISTTTDRVLDRAVRGVAGDADVMATRAGTFDTAISAELARELSTLEGVGRTVGLFRVQAAIRCPEDSSSTCASTVLYGVAPQDAEGVHTFELAEGRSFGDGSSELVLGRPLAQRLDIETGDRLRLADADGDRTVRMSGVLEGTGAGLAHGGWVAYASPETARGLAGAEEGVFSRVDLVLEPGVDLEAWLAANRDAYGGSLLFEPAANVMGELQTFLGAIRGALTVIGGIALFVGAFLIFLTFSVAVAERTRLYGTLRALGAVSRQVRRLVVAEAAILGTLSAAVGVGLGWLLARSSLRFIDALFINLPSLERLEGVGMSAAAAVVLGVTVSVGSAYVPARRAGALTPIGAMRHSGVDEGRPRLWWRVLLLGVGVGVLAADAGLGTGALGALLVLLGAVLTLPAGLPALARIVGAVTRRFARGVGEVGVMHLVKERSRSAYTLGLLMVVLAAILAIGTANRSMGASLERVIDEQLGSDMQVFGNGAVFPDGTGEELSEVEGVARVAEVRFGVTELGEGADARSIFLIVIDPDTYFAVSSFPWIEGNDTDASEMLRSGGLLMDDPTARDLGVAAGDEVVVRTNDGRRTFGVGATYTVFGQGSAIVASLETGRALFGADRPMAFFVDLEPGTDPDAIREPILEALGRPDVSLESAQQTKDFARSQLGGFFGLAYAILAVAAVIGILGLANTLIVSILQRTRELGILRSVGVLRRQLRGMVTIESATLVVVAYLLSVPLGWLLARLTVGGFARTLGFSVGVVWSWSLLPALLVVALVAAGAAALAPARRAGRLDVVDALRFE